MRENFPIRYEYFRERLINRDSVWEINFSISGLEDFQNCWMGCNVDNDGYWLAVIDTEYFYETADSTFVAWNIELFNVGNVFDLHEELLKSSSIYREIYETQIKRD